jgi:hypothetical protein
MDDPHSTPRTSVGPTDADLTDGDLEDVSGAGLAAKRHLQENRARLAAQAAARAATD